MDGISLLYSVFAYLAFGVFLMGCMSKIRKYVATRVPLRISLTSAPADGAGVAYRMITEIGFLKSLFHSNKVTRTKRLRFFFPSSNAALNWFTTFEVYAGFERVA